MLHLLSAYRSLELLSNLNVQPYPSRFSRVIQPDNPLHTPSTTLDILLNIKLGPGHISFISTNSCIRLHSFHLSHIQSLDSTYPTLPVFNLSVLCLFQTEPKKKSTCTDYCYKKIETMNDKGSISPIKVTSPIELFPMRIT